MAGSGSTSSIIPAWLAATAAQPALAGQANQFLGAHQVKYLYQGTKTAFQTTAGSGNVGTYQLYLAQSFTTGSSQTAIGYVTLLLATTSTSPTSTVQISIYASSGGAPTGTPLISVTATPEYVAFAPSYVTFPVPLTGLTVSTTYFIVVSASGQSASQDYTWSKSNQTSGAYTSTNGTAWTAQTYGLLFTVYDQTASGPLVATWEDSGARWTWLNIVGGQVTELAEYTVAQGGGYLQADRTFTYSGTLLTGIS